MRSGWVALALLAVLALLAGCEGSGAAAFPPASGQHSVPDTAPGSAGRPNQHSSATGNPSPAPAAPHLAVDSLRQHADVASGGKAAPYNYAPSVMKDGGSYRMWWCSQLPGIQPAGDDILYATSHSLDGPFSAGGKSAAAAFHGSGGGFDSKHTCDPSVLRVKGTYYLYYTGSSGNREHGNSIGVATSKDGTAFSRIEGGRPIVTPAEDTRRSNGYGVGQPSAVYLNGWVYLMFTDTTGEAAGWNGAGQFVLRSTDPTFRSHVQALSVHGFHPVGSTVAVRDRSIVDAFSADWMWVGALDAFAVAHETKTGTTITFWNADFTRNPYQPVELRGPWQEGPGLVRSPQGHAPSAAKDPCGRVPIDVIRATRNAAAPTGLAHFGLDLHGIDGCHSRSQALAALDGYAVPSPQRTIDLVLGGGLIEIERRSVATLIARKVLDTPVPALDGATVVERIAAGAPAVSAAGRPVALRLADGTLWPISAATAKANDSAVTVISTPQWDSYPLGADLAAVNG
ncbi:MAG: family 43 glycosylhydrolase [Sciscionella sp.]